MSTNSKVNCVLLVDDDSINNYLNHKLLSRLNVAQTIKTVNNGREAISFIDEYCGTNQKCCPELIFLDINMPVMNGFEFLEKYRALNFSNKRKVRIIVLTTSSNENDIHQIVKFGIKDYLRKPLTEDKVKELFAA